MVKHKYLFIGAMLAIGFGCGDDGSSGDPDAADNTDAANPDAADPDAAVPPTPSTIWFHGEVATDGVNKIVRHIHGDALPITPALVIPEDPAKLSGGGNGGFAAFDVTADGTRIAFAADIDETDRFNLYVANSDGTGVTRLVDVGVDADVTRVVFSPDGANIAFSADLELDEQRDAYVVPADGMDATPVLISPVRADAALDVNDIAWADASTVVISGEYTENNFVELVSVDVTVSPIAQVSLVDRARIMSDNNGAKGVLGPFSLTGAGQVVFKSRMDADNAFKLHTVGVDGTNLQIQPGSEIRRADTTVAGIGSFSLSPDGSMVAFSADETLGAFEIFVGPVDGSAAAARVTSGNVMVENMENRGPDFFRPLFWSPDGSMIAFVADILLDNKFEPYVVPAAGGGETRIAVIGPDPNDDAIDAGELAWTLDGSTLYMISDHLGNNEFELFTLDPAMTDQEPTLAFDSPDPAIDLSGVRVRVVP